MKSKRAIATKAFPDAPDAGALVSDPRELIHQSARQTVVQAVDSALTMLCWQIGQTLRWDILKEKRADCGGEIVAALRRQLTWTRFKRLIYLDDPLKRYFHAEMCRIERWSTRVSSYWTDVLPKTVLERKLHQAVLLARARLGTETKRDNPL